ncbi:MAG TPA: signal peptidase I [Terriglobales bacterium]|nr:signal peptidase I [Terriglobales bacterium]
MELEEPISERPAGPVLSAPPRTILTVSRWMRDLLVSLLISGFIIVFLYQPVKVEGTSMLPGLQDQERIFVNKFVYHLESISRGDIVVFHYPRDVSKSYIKRVIALGGDRVRIEDGVVFVNGQEMYEPYVPSEFLDVHSYPEMVIPAGAYFVLGDHRSSSSDSRDFGPVQKKFIYGKAVFVYWPVDKLGMLR